MATKLIKVGQYIYDEPASYEDFSGGINTDSSNENLLKNQLRDALNMRYDNLGLRKRFGATKHADIVFSKDLTNIQGIFLFTQVNPWLIIAANGRLYYGLYNAGGTIDLNELPIKSKIELANPNSINTAYQLYNLPIKTTELGTEIHDGYFYKPQVYNDGELIFQNKRNIEGVPHRNKFYIATGTRIVEVSIENEKPAAYLIDPYKPNGIELTQIGPNFLSPFPTLALNHKAESVKTAVHGVIPIAMSDGSVKLQAIMSYEQGKSAKDYRFKWEKIVDNDAIPVKFNDTYDLIFKSELDTKGIPISQGKDSIIITADEAESFYYRVTFAREFERVDETVETSALKLETIAIPNGSYQDYIINQLIDWFGSATSILYTDELKQPSLEWAKINSCVKVTGDGNKLLFYDDNYNSGNWYKTIIDNPRYITNRGGLNFKTTLNEQLIKVIDFKGIIVCFSYNPYLGGNISIVMGDGDDYNDGSGQFSPYARRVVNKQISTDNPSTVHIAENIIIFKYKDMVYMIEGSQLSNEIVSVQSINDHVRTPSAYVNIPWEDNNCIAELTEDHYALIWKEKTKYVDGQMVIERPAQRIKMYYKLAFQHGGRIIFPWLRDEGATFNVDHLIQIGNRSYHLYDNLLIGYHEKKFTDLGEKYPVRLFLRGYDLNYGQYIKMLHKLSLYYSRGDKTDIDIKVNAYNEANYKILKDPTVTHTQQNLAVQYYDDATGYKKVDNTLLDVKLFTTSRRFPALFAHVTIEVENDDDFAFVSIGFVYKTRDLPKTTLFEYYKNIWTDIETPMTIMEDYKPLTVGTQPQSNNQPNVDMSYYIQLFDSFKKDFIGKTEILNLFQMSRDFIEYDNEDEFPFVGEPGKIYLARYKNTALEGQEPVIEPYNMMFRYSTSDQIYIPLAGGGTGGGGTTTSVRLIPQDGQVMTYTAALGTNTLLKYKYINPDYTTATRIIYVNDVPKQTSNILTGDGEVNVTNYLQQGLNTVRIYISDPEGRASQLTFRITMDTILLTSSYNDANVTVNAGVVIPYTVNGNATVREMHFIVDGEETIEIAYGTNNMKGFMNLTHGSHILEMYCNGIFKDVDGNTLYEIESNRLRFTMIYDDNVSNDIIIATKFNLTSIDRGIAFDVDYVVYSPILETVPVNLKINDEIVSSLVINSSRKYWSIKTLNAGNHILTIETSTTVLNIPITINPVDLPVEIVQDDFLKLYMSAFGRNNADINREIWDNIHGENVNVEFNNINYASTGWLNDSLRLVGDANAVIGFKPFATAIPASGRTIELDFTTRNTLQEGVVLLECLNNDIGFVITPQVVQLKGSNTYVETKFKEDEHVKIGFTITPGENIIITYINGVISGLAFYSENTTFRQLDPQNIFLNNGGGSIDFHSIRVYDRALTAKEMLGNYIAEISDFEELIETYEFNDVYDEYGNPSKTKMEKLIPIMMFDAPIMPQFKGDKRPVKVTFEHPYEPEKNFVRNADKTVIDWQGTSSIQYPVKNYKITMNKSEKYSIEEGWIPERKFTLKADYMDSSHSHNTGLAMLFDTMYAYRLPPGITNPLIRSTIYGYPIALFYRANESAPYEYKGVYNFNLDKDCTDTFGLNNKGDFPNCQSFEVSYNADSGAGAFADNTLENVISSFEARYPELDEDVFDYDTLMVYDLPAVTAHFANLRAMIQWVMDNNNLPTFKENFDLHFDREYTFKYLIATLVFGLVDNLGKNMMINTWDGQIWYPNFYDIDTAIGLENQGRNVHDYDIEIGDLGAYATSNSYLWANILTQFNIELREVYRNLRGDIFSYENILQFLKENQIDKISQSQYNLDAYAKYIGVTTSWLWMAQGTSEEHMKRWLTLRLSFLDSKYVGGEFAQYIAIRINVLGGYQDTTMTITPVITQYCTIKWTDTPDVQVKTEANEQAVITGPSVLGTGALTNIEVSVYGAKFLSDIGDLSTLYPSSISTEFAQRLRKLKIGSQVEGYDNPYLEKISVGSNTYLEEVDLTNCSNLGSVSGGTQILDLSGAENLKRLFAGNTKLVGVSFARGAALNEFVLPATIRELIMINMIFLDPTKMTFEGINNIQTLRLENIPALNPIEFFNMCPNVVYVRLTGITMSIYGLTAIEDMIEKIWDHDLYIQRVNEGVPNPHGYLYLGIEDSGQTRDEPVIEGVVKVLTNTIPTTQLLNDIALILPDINERMEIAVIQDGLTFGMIGSDYGITAYAGNATVLQLPKENNTLLTPVNNLIQNTVDGWVPITTIGIEAFMDNSTLIEVVIPDTYTTIGSKAFKNLANLETLVLPNQLTSIEMQMIQSCPKITSIVIPSQVTTIKELGIANMVGVTAIMIPSNVTTMEVNAIFDTPNAIIYVTHESKPEGWHENWLGGQDLMVIWGFSGIPVNYTFDTQGGTTIETISNTLLFTAPTSPTKYGYDFNKWQHNGVDVSFPFYSPVDTTLTAVWTLWEYEVKYMVPNSLSTGYEVYATQYVTYGNALGTPFTNVGTPVHDQRVFQGTWAIGSEEGTVVDATYVINQDALSIGYIVELYGIFSPSPFNVISDNLYVVNTETLQESNTIYKISSVDPITGWIASAQKSGNYSVTYFDPTGIRSNENYFNFNTTTYPVYITSYNGIITVIIGTNKILRTYNGLTKQMLSSVTLANVYVTVIEYNNNFYCITATGHIDIYTKNTHQYVSSITTLSTIVNTVYTVIDSIKEDDIVYITAKSTTHPQGNGTYCIAYNLLTDTILVEKKFSNLTTFRPKKMNVTENYIVIIDSYNGYFFKMNKTTYVNATFATTLGFRYYQSSYYTRPLLTPTNDDINNAGVYQGDTIIFAMFKPITGNGDQLVYYLYDVHNNVVVAERMIRNDLYAATGGSNMTRLSSNSIYLIGTFSDPYNAEDPEDWRNLILSI